MVIMLFICVLRNQIFRCLAMFKASMGYKCVLCGLFRQRDEADLSVRGTQVMDPINKEKAEGVRQINEKTEGGGSE